MKDIAPELLERIEKDFERVFSSDSTIKALYRKTKDGTATYEDAQKFAVRTGRLLADVFRRNLSSEILPDGRLYYNIASRILNSTLGNNHSLISGFAADVQYYANSKAGVGIKVQPAQLDQERIDGIVNIVSGKHRYDDIAYMLDEPVITFGQAVVDDFLKRNIDFQGKSGLSPRVVRRATGNPCPWCEAVAGSYTYPDVPHDVYRRHQRCRCIVEYEPGNGRRQNVHSKEWTDAAELEKRKSIGLETPLKKDPKTVQPLEKLRKGGIIITDKQYGKKIGKHARDYGLDPSKKEDRNEMNNIIHKIVYDYDEHVKGEWRGWIGESDFFIKGTDVVVLNNNAFITILENGVTNARVKDARKRKV